MPHRPLRSLALPRTIAVLAVVVLAVAGCGSDDGDETSGAPSAGDGTGAADRAAGDDPLDGRVLVATSVTEDGTERDVVDGTELRMSFTAGQISVNAGCNTSTAGYSVDDGRLTLDGEVATTAMGCEQALEDQDTWIAEVLSRPGEVDDDGDGVTLTFGDTVIVLADVEDAELVGPTWTVDSLITGTGDEGAAASVDPGIGATLTLADDGTYALATGCNSGGGGYEVDEGAGTITFDQPRLTRMACADQARSAVESTLVSVLDGEATYELSELSLILTRAGSGVGFRAG